jgi:hypothetical protein
MRCRARARRPGRTAAGPRARSAPGRARRVPARGVRRGIGAARARAAPGRAGGDRRIPRALAGADRARSGRRNTRSGNRSRGRALSHRAAARRRRHGRGVPGGARGGRLSSARGAETAPRRALRQSRTLPRRAPDPRPSSIIPASLACTTAASAPAAGRTWRWNTSKARTCWRSARRASWRSRIAWPCSCRFATPSAMPMRTWSCIGISSRRTSTSPPKARSSCWISASQNYCFSRARSPMPPKRRTCRPRSRRRSSSPAARSPPPPTSTHSA